MYVLKTRALTKSYAHGTGIVLSGIDFDLKQHEVCAIVGASGSGKSTFLKLIAGLEIPDSGTIELNGTVVSDGRVFLPPEKRRVGFVFQDFALFPHLTVEQNVGFGIARAPDKRGRVAELLELVGLTQHATKYPGELSGGEQQRVALVRALAPKPTLLLMDEPFSNLDGGIRKEVRSFVFDIIRRTGLSCVFVTHDLDDAMVYGDTIAILHRARFEQRGAPRALYTAPASTYVAGLFGDINFLTPAFLERLGLPVRETHHYTIRATEIGCSVEATPGALPGRIVGRTFLGSHFELSVRIEGLQDLKVLVAVDATPDGEAVFVAIDRDRIICFEKDSDT